MAGADFEATMLYALQCIGCSHLTPKPEQLASVRHVYEGRDVFVWLPTGYGKSLCYQVLPFVFDHKYSRTDSLVVVVSPLVSLMVDQVDGLRQKGVKAAIMSTLSKFGDHSATLLATDTGLKDYKLLFCASEAIQTGRWRDAFEEPELAQRVVTVVIDEAHCVSKWCHDFRPSYGCLSDLRALFSKDTPMMACSATVTKNIRQEVMSKLEMVDCAFVSTSPDRPNISYEVCPRVNFENDLNFVLESLKFQKLNAPRVIIYCRSLDMCASLYAHFHYELGDESYYPSGAPHLCCNRLFGMYHSNTPERNKDTILKSLSKKDGIVRVIFATVALGMGINLCDVNTIIHYGGMNTIDDYFQESGRGGRSGEKARSIVYWKPIDCPKRKELSSTRDHETAAVRRYLENDTSCRRNMLLKYFDSSCVKNSPKDCCDICSRVCN